MSYNILEAYQQQKQKKQGKNKRKKGKGRKKDLRKESTCLDCFHGSKTDSYGFNVPDRRAYCSYLESVVQVGCSRNCPWFKPRKRGGE